MISTPNFITLFVHLFMTISSSSIFIFFLNDRFTNNKIGSNQIGYLIFGIIGTTFLALLFRFFKIIITRKNKIILIYPYWIRIINRNDIVGFNTFRAQVIRHVKDFDFTIIKTKNNAEFIFSNFIYWNYNKLFNDITFDLTKDDTLKFWKIKHIYLLTGLSFLTIILIAILAG